LAVGVVGAVALLVYLRLHGTAFLEARLKNWIGSPGWRATVARILLGFARGVQTIRTWSDLAGATFYSALHWFLIVIVYFVVAHAFSGQLSTLSAGDAMLVMAFSLVGSAVQLPAVGGGAQVATILVFTTIFNVPTEEATVASLVLWVITFASVTVVGIPLLVREGFSLGQLRELSDEEKKEESGALPPGSTQATLAELEKGLSAARPGDPQH
jgi:hypothetical protein